MKNFYGFSFKAADISKISGMHLNATVGDYDFYYKGKSIFLHDKPNSALLSVETRRKQASPKFHDDLIRDYEFVYHIKWSGSLVNKQLLTADDAKFIFEQAEKYLKDSIDTSAIILARVNTIVAIIAAILIGLTSYIVSEYRKTCVFDNVLITSSIGVIYFFILGYFAAKNIPPNTTTPWKSSPSKPHGPSTTPPCSKPSMNRNSGTSGASSKPTNSSTPITSST